MRYLGLGVLIYTLISISDLVLVALFLATFYVKKKISKMDEVKWDLYFKSMSNSSYLIKLGILSLISLTLISVFGYYIFTAFGFESGAFLSVFTGVLGIARMLFKFKKNKNKLLEKINKLRSV